MRASKPFLTLALIALLLTPFVLSGQGGHVPAPLPGSLDAKFRRYELAAFDTASLLEQARAGYAQLTLMGVTYDLVLRPHVFQAPGAKTELATADGRFIPDPTVTFESVAFHGSVAGVPGSRALLTFTQIGLDGFVESQGLNVQFEPLAPYVPGAPPGSAVVFRLDDLIMKTGELPELHASVPDEAAPGPHDGVEGQADSRQISIWVDSQFYTQYVSCWSCKVDNVMSRVNYVWQTSSGLGFTLNVINKWGCTDTACDTTWGSTSTASGTLLSEWANKMKDINHDNFDMFHLFTGKNLDGSTIGLAYNPGRYGLSQMITTGTGYHADSNYEAGLLVNHETGHNFHGEHSLASGSVYHTHNPSSGVYCTVYHKTIMYPSFDHNPNCTTASPSEMVEYFTTANKDRINACNDGSWVLGSWTPGSGVGYGWDCIKS